MKKQQTVDKISERIEKEIGELSEAKKVLIAGHNLGIIEQIKALADKMGIRCDILLLVYAALIFNTAIPESEPKPATVYELFKSDYIQ